MKKVNNNYKMFKFKDLWFLFRCNRIIIRQKIMKKIKNNYKI